MAGDWKMVPVAPTPEMVKAGRELLGGMVEDADADYRRIYEAMLAASPGLLRTFLDEAEKAGVTGLKVNLPNEAEHVAEVGETFALHWAGRGSIAPLIERHGLKVGSKLYSRPEPSPGLDAARFPKHTCGGAMSRNPHADAGKPGHTLTEGCVYECIPCTVKSRHEWSQRALKAENLVREQAAPSPAASADEWIAEAERLVWALRQSAREDGAQGSDGYDSPSIISAEKQAASDEAALLAHLKAYPKG